MQTKFTIVEPDTDVVEWVLRHNPAWPVPFVTLQGTEHVWNWDFISGELMQDGVPLLGFAIAIELEVP